MKGKSKTRKRRKRSKPALLPSPPVSGSAKPLSLVEALLFSGVREVEQIQNGSERPVKTIYDGTQSFWEPTPREGRWHGKAWHPVKPVLGGWHWDWVEVWVPAVSPNEKLTDCGRERA